MKHARLDYQDKIICIRSLRELKQDLELLESVEHGGVLMHDDIQPVIDRIRSNILGGHIPEQEPVMLLRAQDRYAPGAVRNHFHRMGADKHPGVDVGPMVAAMANHADAMEKWPVKKVPDMPVKAE